jgi:hypothetical protein
MRYRGDDGSVEIGGEWPHDARRPRYSTQSLSPEFQSVPSKLERQLIMSQRPQSDKLKFVNYNCGLTPSFSARHDEKIYDTDAQYLALQCSGLEL